MKIVVGLGNPGKRYENTPHNIGFDVIDRLAAISGSSLRRSLRFNARLGECVVAGQPALLVKPLTFMNGSGESVAPVMRYRKLAVADLIVVVDDADLPTGHLRLRAQGGSGGHRGLESLIANLGSNAFARVRIGIGRREDGRDLVAHVLSRFSAAERREMDQVVDRAARAVVCLVGSGPEAAMNEFNS